MGLTTVLVMLRCTASCRRWRGPRRRAHVAHSTPVLVEGVRVDADEELAEQGSTGHRIAPVGKPAATKTPARGLAQASVH